MKKNIFLLTVFLLVFALVSCDSECGSSQSQKDSVNAISYTIHFDANGGNGTMKDFVCKGEIEYYLPPMGFTHSNKDKKFGFWNTSKDGKGTSYSITDTVKDLSNTDNDIVTLYAIWIDQDDLTIMYHDPKNISNPNIFSFKISEQVTSIDLTCDGYIFGGWKYAFSGIDKASPIEIGGFYEDTNLEKVGWYHENADSSSHPVGKKPYPNRLGIYDMSGNVFELCEDWYDEEWGNSITSENVYNPIDPDKPDYRNSRVVRGGSWSTNPFPSLVSTRSSKKTGDCHYLVGLRVVTRDN